MDALIERVWDSWVGRLLGMLLGAVLIGLAVHALQAGTVRVPVIRHFVRFHLERAESPVQFHLWLAFLAGAGLWMFVQSLRGRLIHGRDD